MWNKLFVLSSSIYNVAHVYEIMHWSGNDENSTKEKLTGAEKNNNNNFREILSYHWIDPLLWINLEFYAQKIINYLLFCFVIPLQPISSYYA